MSFTYNRTSLRGIEHWLMGKGGNSESDGFNQAIWVGSSYGLQTQVRLGNINEKTTPNSGQATTSQVFRHHQGR